MSLRFATRLLLFFFLFFGGLYYARDFLIPVAFAGVLAMLLLPLCNWFERKGIGKSLATTFSILTFLLTIAALLALLGWQVSSLLSDMGNIEKKIMESIQQGQQWISKTLGISQQEQQKALQQSRQGGSGGMSKAIQSIPAAIMGGITNVIIVIVYLFLFLRFRLHLKRFVIKIVPEQDRRTALDILHNASGVTQKYLGGMGMMIVCLWVMYGIGFSIVGVKSAIFFAVLCGTLELVPFIGNIVGTLITLLVSLTQSGGGSNVVIGIIVTYFVVQTLQSYILEPLVVGKEVKIHPLFTIMVIVLGELIWGIAGMVLSVPILGMAKIICDRVPALHSYGYLIGEEENAGDPSWKERIRAKLGRVIKEW